MMNSVCLKNIVKSYTKDKIVIHNFNVEIQEGEFVVLVGPSGCGKSTLLRIIAGLETVTSGDIYIHGQYMNHVSPKDRDIAMVFQNYALYPHMNVYNNLAFGLKLRKVPKAQIEKQVHWAAGMLEISEFLHRKPKELSGGQRQRVALGRALVRNPKVFLFDEPLSNLDAKLRVQMRTQIKKLHHELKTTMIYVTHDQVEAMTMGDRIMILHDGITQQVGNPMEVYQSPNNMFVGSFIGSPAMNFIEGKLVRHETFVGDGISLNVKNRPELNKLKTDTLYLGIRPEDILVGKGEILANLEITEPLGNESILNFKIGSQQLIARDTSGQIYEPDTRIPITFKPDRILFFDKKTGVRIC
jgi:multiple sugar transport system ATP-binding protein